MTEKFPPQHENTTSMNTEEYLDKRSELLDELEKIQKNIAQDSLTSSNIQIHGWDSSYSTRQDEYNLSRSIDVTHKSDISHPHDSFRRFYRFDFEHQDDDKYESQKSHSSKPLSHEIPDSNIAVHDEWTEPTISRKRKKALRKSHPLQRGFKSKELSRRKKLCMKENKKNLDNEIKQDYRRFDDVPVVIPFRQNGIRNTVWSSKLRNAQPFKIASTPSQDVHSVDRVNETAIPTLPWQFFSRYENETFVKLTGNASNLSLVIGWAAIACGVMIFVRSFFVSSMIWLNYGLPILSLGAVSLFLGVILSILCEKMQHINELKQSLTVQRILHPNGKKSDNSHDTNICKHSSLKSCSQRILEKKSIRSGEPFVAFPCEKNLDAIIDDIQNQDELTEDIFDRLIQLRSKVNDLISNVEFWEQETK